jgi:hypothetical protein
LRAKQKATKETKGGKAQEAQRGSAHTHRLAGRPIRAATGDRPSLKIGMPLPLLPVRARLANLGA